MPPDVGIGKPNDLYPCGIWGPGAGAGGRSQRGFVKTDFLQIWPEGNGREECNRIAGQSVAIPKGNYAKIHILGAAVEPDQEAEFGLGYDATVELKKIVMSA